MDYYPQPRPVLFGASNEESGPQTQTAPIRIGPPRYPPAPPLAGDAPEPFDNSNGRSRSYEEFYSQLVSFRTPLIVLCAIAAVYASLQIVLGTSGFANPILGGSVLLGEVMVELVAIASLVWLGGREYILVLGSCIVLVSLGAILAQWQYPVLWIAIVILVLFLRPRMWHHYFIRARHDINAHLVHFRQRFLRRRRHDMKHSYGRVSRQSASPDDRWLGRTF